MPGFRFQLRTLLIAMLLLAVAISVGNAIVARNRAEIRILSADDVARIFPDPKVVEENGRFRVTFRTRYASVADVAKRVGLNQLISSTQAQERHQITFESYESGALEELIELWPAGDVFSPNSNQCSISGLVVDEDDRPVVGALVNLYGSAQSITDCSTRRDGSFTLCFDIQSNSEKYSLRISYGDGPHVMTTLPFTVKSPATERSFQVRVRR